MADLLVEKQGHATIFTINRPDRMNALGGTVNADLSAGLKEFEADPDQYVAILTATGDRAFCAGGDLKEMADGAATGSRLPISPQPDISGLAACEKVTIAAVNGLAVAGGLELAISCDIRIAARDAVARRDHLARRRSARRGRRRQICRPRSVPGRARRQRHLARIERAARRRPRGRHTVTARHCEE